MVQSYQSSTSKVLEDVIIWVILQVNNVLWCGFSVKGNRDRMVVMEQVSGEMGWHGFN